MFGALVVLPRKGNIMPIPHLFEYDDEFVMVVSDWYNSNWQESVEEYKDPSTDTHTMFCFESMLCNGKWKYPCKNATNDPGNCVVQPRPKEPSRCAAAGSYETYHVQPGKRYRFRVIGAQSRLSFAMSIDQHNMTIIAVDGFFLSNMPNLMAKTSGFFLSPGKTWDFILETPLGGSGNFWIRAAHMMYRRLDPIYNRPLAIVHYSGAPAIDPTSVLNSGPMIENTGSLKSLTGLDYWYPDKSLEWRMTRKADGRSYTMNNESSFVWPKLTKKNPEPMLFSGDGGPFSRNVIPIATNLDVQIIIYNDSPTYHPIHIHGYHFRILFESEAKANRRFNRTTDFLNMVNPPHAHTVSIPSAGFVILHLYTDNVGFWLIHCHMDLHLEGGMALILRVGSTQELNVLTNSYEVQRLPSMRCESGCAFRLDLPWFDHEAYGTESKKREYTALISSVLLLVGIALPKFLQDDSKDAGINWNLGLFIGFCEPHANLWSAASFSFALMTARGGTNAFLLMIVAYNAAALFVTLVEWVAPRGKLIFHNNAALVCSLFPAILIFPLGLACCSLGNILVICAAAGVMANGWNMCSQLARGFNVGQLNYQVKHHDSTQWFFLGNKLQGLAMFGWAYWTQWGRPDPSVKETVLFFSLPFALAMVGFRNSFILNPIAKKRVECIMDILGPSLIPPFKKGKPAKTEADYKAALKACADVYLSRVGTSDAHLKDYFDKLNKTDFEDIGKIQKEIFMVNAGRQSGGNNTPLLGGTAASAPWFWSKSEKAVTVFAYISYATVPVILTLVDFATNQRGGKLAYVGEMCISQFLIFLTGLFNCFGSVAFLARERWLKHAAGTVGTPLALPAFDFLVAFVVWFSSIVGMSVYLYKSKSKECASSYS